MARIVIIGGGIGGLALAGCLAKRGIAASVFEKARELREVGAAIAVWPNAGRVLAKLGVLEELAKHGHIPPVGAMRSMTGRILKRMVDLKLDVPTIFTHRAQLHAALLEAVPGGLGGGAVHLDKACVAIEYRDVNRQVRAKFSDGTFSEWADGLVGADGIHSFVREQILGDGPPIYRGYVAWRGVAEFNSGEEMVGETWGNGERFGFIPLGGGRVGWWATANKSEAQAGELCRQTPASWKEELLRRFNSWHTPIREVLERTVDSALLCNAICDREPLQGTAGWGKGIVTLMGDAAHPTTPNLGQGGCMAIEDAAVLAHAVAAIPSVEGAFPDL